MQETEELGTAKGRGAGRKMHRWEAGVGREAGTVAQEVRLRGCSAVQCYARRGVAKARKRLGTFAFTTRGLEEAQEGDREGFD